ncbi:C40 family peptidase [Nonomuraea sp. NPDC050394]|uniref:C40 family peptidase n=1 Tax=Nonomuraea sp. NPDC050394 TaxID=3364363 RepID=UPI0037AEB320
MTTQNDNLRRAVGPADPPHASGIRQDLAFLVTSRRRRDLGRLIPFIVVTLVAVLTADVLLLGEFQSPPEPEVKTAQSVRRKPAAPPKENLVAQTSPQDPGVRPLGRLHKPNLFVVTKKPFTTPLLGKVAKVRGIRALELADAASVMIDGKRVQTLGVDPSTFRAYTPKVTAASDGLWTNVARGDVAVSFVLGNDGGLTLHRQVSGPGGPLRVGAYATTGFGAVDAVVSKQTARTLGLPHDNALIVSAPKANSANLRKKLMGILPKGTQIAEINPVGPPPVQNLVYQGNSFMSGEQITVALKAALSKLGRPYVWGAEGPETFDCSGLVQWAYAQAGIRVPRVTHQQWLAGPQIPYAQAQPGDLIFWRHDPTNPGYISHVAIYLGGGKMLQAPRTGDVVKISPVGMRNFAGVVRIAPSVAARVR